MTAASLSEVHEYFSHNAHGAIKDTLCISRACFGQQFSAE